MDLEKIEQELAKALQQKKLANEAEQRRIQKILEQNNEYKAMKAKVETAKMTKERTKQMVEEQFRKVEAKVN